MNLLKNDILEDITLGPLNAILYKFHIGWVIDELMERHKKSLSKKQEIENLWPEFAEKKRA